MCCDYQRDRNTAGDVDCQSDANSHRPRVIQPTDRGKCEDGGDERNLTPVNSDLSANQLRDKTPQHRRYKRHTPAAWCWDGVGASMIRDVENACATRDTEHQSDAQD